MTIQWPDLYVVENDIVNIYGPHKSNPPIEMQTEMHNYESR